MKKKPSTQKEPPAVFLFIQGALRENGWLTLFTVTLLAATAAAFIFPHLLGISRDTIGLPFRLYLVFQAAAIVLLFAALVKVDQKHWAVKNRLDYLSGHDSLTNLPNRSLLISQVDELIPPLKRTNRLSAVLYTGLDGIQEISDTFGQSTTDSILKTISNRLLGNIRRGDIVGRLGEDEFVLVLTDVAPDKDLTGIVQNIIAEISKPLTILKQEFTITSSIGLSFFPYDGDTAETLVKHSHMAMLRARSKGGNQYQYYDSLLKKMAVKRLELARDLRFALERKEFTIYYQPQVDIPTGALVGVEALLRWNHPEQGMVSPSKFIPVAEETGLIIPMGEWTLQTACRQLKDWGKAGYEGLRVAVNISAREFQEKNLVRVIRGTLENTGLDPKFLELEMTESTMQDADMIIAKLRELNAMGLELSVDDFGTGYSSLNYLKRFPIHTLKIDKSFIRTLTQRSDDQVIVKVIINLAHTLNLRALAEGVETSEQLMSLKSLGCDRMQGFLFSPPIPPDKMVPFLERMKHRIPG